MKAAEKKGGLLGYFETLAESKKKGNIEFSLGNLMSCLCCTTEDQNDTKKELMVMADKLDKIEKALNIQPGQAGVSNGGANGVKKLLKHPTVDMSGTEEQTKEENKEDKKKVKPSVNFADVEPKTKTTEDGEDAWRNPYWIKDTDEMNQKCELLAKSPKLRIPDDEVQFWIDMVKEYLQPDCKAGLGPEEKKKVAEGLKELKNSVALGFVLMNVIWITAIYMLQNQKDMIGIKWPLGEKGPNISWDTTDPERDNIMILQYEYLQLEPVGMVFMIVFIFIIGIQLVGMFFHRLMTLGHIVASTELNLFKRNRFDTEDYLNRHGVEVIKEIQDTLEPDAAGATLEEMVEQTLSDLTAGDDNTVRRLSRTATIKNLHRSDTISALKKKQSVYGQRKETIRRKTMRVKKPSTIMEGEEENDYPKLPAQSFDVARTRSKKDPDGLEFRDV